MKLLVALLFRVIIVAASHRPWDLSANTRSFKTKLVTVNDVILINIVFCDGRENLKSFSVILDFWSRNRLVILAICKLLGIFLPQVILGFDGHTIGSLHFRRTILRPWESISDLSQVSWASNC